MAGRDQQLATLRGALEVLPIGAVLYSANISQYGPADRLVVVDNRYAVHVLRKTPHANLMSMCQSPSPSFYSAVTVVELMRLALPQAVKRGRLVTPAYFLLLAACVEAEMQMGRSTTKWGIHARDLVELVGVDALRDTYWAVVTSCEFPRSVQAYLDVLNQTVYE